MVWCAPPAGVDFERAAQRLRDEEGILVGGAYGGPRGRNPAAEAARAMRFVTHLQTPPRAVRALLSGLARVLR